MAHDRDDRRARAHFFGDVIGADKALFDIRFGHPLHAVAKIADDQFGGVLIEHVIDFEELALLHQIFDEVDGPRRHPVGKFLHGDRFGDDHFSDDFRLIIVAE